MVWILQYSEFDYWKKMEYDSHIKLLKDNSLVLLSWQQERRRTYAEWTKQFEQKNETTNEERTYYNGRPNYYPFNQKFLDNFFNGRKQSETIN